MSKRPIGLFDSGVGGTSIWKEVHALLPNENTIYLADSLNAPYGLKGKQKIIELSIKNTELLIKKDCKLIIVACNTATTNAISYLRTHYNIPFIGIEPAIKPAALNSISKTIGILATKGTLSSELFHTTTSLYGSGSGIKIIEQEGEGLVQLIENGLINSPEMTTLLELYLKPMKAVNIDYLVLGCSHYPYLIPQLYDLLPKHVKIIDSGEAVARQTRAVLKKEKLINTITGKTNPKFYTNGHREVIESLIRNKYNIKYLAF